MSAGKKRSFADIRRSDFLLETEDARFDWMICASHPAPVRQRIQELSRGLDVEGSSFVYKNVIRLDQNVRKAAADYLGLESKDSDLIAQTESTTMGLTQVLQRIRLDCDQEIVITDRAFYSVQKVVDLRRQWESTKVRHIHLLKDPAKVTSQEIVKNLVQGIREETRVLVLTWVCSSTGVKLPLQRIGQEIETLNRSRPSDRRIIVLLDGIHGFGVEPLSFQEMGCDIFVAGCHKWLFGPRGTGIICAKREAWVLIDPLIPTFNPGSFPGAIHSRGGIQSYENSWALAEAFAYHANVLGKKRVLKRTQDLVRRLKQGLSDLAGKIEIITPLDKSFSSAIVCCRIDGICPRAAVQKLRNRGVIVTISSSDFDEERYIRFSVSALNRMSEIERAVDEMASIGESSLYVK